MKVILLQDVAKIGKKGAIVDVPTGYAMNQLVPLKKATAATGANLKAAQSKAATQAADAEGASSAFMEAKKILSQESVIVSAKMNEQEHMFEALQAQAVVDAAKAVGAVITADMVRFIEPVKTAGEHKVKLVAADHSSEFLITVTKSN